jgi:predicted dehydrogenase
VTINMTRIGVIGTGGIAGVHLDNLSKIEGVEIAALCDISEKTLLSRQELYGGRGYSDYREMLAQEELDGVLLCTPAKVRKGPIEACIAKGIPVFVEKPPSVTLEEGEEIRALLDANHHPHFVGFVFRWAEFLAPVLEVIRSRQIYAIQSHYFADMMYPEARRRCAAEYYDKSLSGGMIGDQALHIIDLIRYLTQSEAQQVTAFANNFLCPKQPGITTEETVVFQMRMKNGVVANHLHTWAFPRWDIGLALFGANFHFNFNLTGNRVDGLVDGQEFTASQEVPLHRPIIESFVKMVRTGDRKQIRSDYADALKTLALTQAVDQAVVSGGMVSFQ